MSRNLPRFCSCETAKVKVDTVSDNLGIAAVSCSFCGASASKVAVGRYWEVWQSGETYLVRMQPEHANPEAWKNGKCTPIPVAYCYSLEEMLEGYDDMSDGVVTLAPVSEGWQDADEDMDDDDDDDLDPWQR